MKHNYLTPELKAIVKSIADDFAVTNILIRKYGDDMNGMGVFRNGMRRQAQRTMRAINIKHRLFYADNRREKK